MEGVEAEGHALGQAFADRGPDEGGAVGGHHLDARALGLGHHAHEEAPDRVGGPALQDRGYLGAGVVVEDHVVLAENLGLVDAEAHDPVEPAGGVRLQPPEDAGHDRLDGVPIHAELPRRGRVWLPERLVRHRRLEVVGVARPGVREGHRLDPDAMLGATHAPHPHPDEAFEPAVVEVPPSPEAGAGVVGGASSAAFRAPVVAALRLDFHVAAVALDGLGYELVALDTEGAFNEKLWGHGIPPYWIAPGFIP